MQNSQIKNLGSKWNLDYNLDDDVLTIKNIDCSDNKIERSLLNEIYSICSSNNVRWLDIKIPEQNYSNKDKTILFLKQSRFGILHSRTFITARKKISEE